MKGRTSWNPSTGSSSAGTALPIVTSAAELLSPAIPRPRRFEAATLPTFINRAANTLSRRDKSRDTCVTESAVFVTLFLGGDRVPPVCADPSSKNSPRRVARQRFVHWVWLVFLGPPERAASIRADRDNCSAIARNPTALG